jgi:hypothetical protein
MSFSDLQPVSPASGCRSFLGSHGKALAPLAGCRRCDRAPPDGPFRLWEEPVRKLRPDDVRELRDEDRDMRDDVRELGDEVRDMRDDVRELRDNDVGQCRPRDWRRRMASHFSSP